MSQTLYRKYRPQTFADVTDQDHIKTTIGQEIKSGQIAHAFLFSGPRGVGKTTVARLIAKSVNCITRPAGDCEPCNSCAVCQEIDTNRCFDVIEIDAASQTGVDQVRENIIANAKMGFVLDNPFKLSRSSRPV